MFNFRCEDCGEFVKGDIYTLPITLEKYNQEITRPLLCEKCYAANEKLYKFFKHREGKCGDCIGDHHNPKCDYATKEDLAISRKEQWLDADNINVLELSADNSYRMEMPFDKEGE